MSPDIILDISRLLSRVMHRTPTGVDRVEMAYARGLLATAPDRLAFAAVHPTGLYGRLPLPAVRHFLDRTERHWEDAAPTTIWAQRRYAADMLNLLRPRRVPVGTRPRVAAYLQTSPHHLTRPALVRSILNRERARFICMVHDLIPLVYPEYARPDGAAQHRVRIETIAALADGVIANSHATLSDFRPWLAGRTAPPQLLVAHLGTHDAPPLSTPAPALDAPCAGRPYYVCIGTIEPRKNHLLLLNIWRRMAEERGPTNIPRIVLVGRRGWENEQIVDMLERCPALVGCVEEYNGLSDRATRDILRGARALLLPSFAEGYGMPVTEALDLGVPVICSDLPALREAGGEVPLYLDPLDGPAWRGAIEAFVQDDDPARLAQLDRFAHWQRPDWKTHIARVHDLLEAVAS